MRVWRISANMYLIKLSLPCVVNDCVVISFAINCQECNLLLKTEVFFIYAKTENFEFCCHKTVYPTPVPLNKSYAEYNEWVNSEIVYTNTLYFLWLSLNLCKWKMIIVLLLYFMLFHWSSCWVLFGFSCRTADNHFSFLLVEINYGN